MKKIDTIDTNEMNETAANREQRRHGFKNFLRPRKGNILTDHAGLTAAGLVIVLIIIVWAVPYTRNTFLPQVGSWISNLWGYANN